MSISQDFAVHVSTSLERTSDPMAAVAANALQDATQQFDVTLAQISENQDLSAAGKSNARGRALSKFSATVGAWRASVIAPLEKTAESLAAKLVAAAAPAPVSELEALRREVRFAEIRKSLEGIDPILLHGEYNSFPPEVQSALRDAPPRLQRTDKGELVWTDLAPDTAAPSSPELQLTRTLSASLDGLANQALALADRWTSRATSSAVTSPSGLKASAGI